MCFWPSEEESGGVDLIPGHSGQGIWFHFGHFQFSPRCPAPDTQALLWAHQVSAAGPCVGSSRAFASAN